MGAGGRIIDIEVDGERAVTIHGYGLILGIAMMAGWWWASKLWRQQTRHQIDFDIIAVWAIVGGVVGARLYHVVDYWWYYQTRLYEVVAVWQGGLAIWGAVIGGGVALTLLSWWRKLPLLMVLDVLAAALPLSQSIGRWGNLINYELYGKPTTSFLGWWIPVRYRPENLMEVAKYHPLFLYESLLSLGLFLIIWLGLSRRWSLGSGEVTGLYLMGYGVIRFLLEPLRLTSWIINGWPVAQLISIGAVIIGGLLYLRVRWNYAKNS